MNLTFQPPLPPAPQCETSIHPIRSAPATTWYAHCTCGWSTPDFHDMQVASYLAHRHVGLT